MKRKRKTIHPVILQLREVRKARNIKGYDLANKIGVNESMVCCWERGHRHPSWFTFICWAESLGVEIHVKDKNDAA
jgi:transcriptional regulator with XRE-family HTH domain